MAALVTATLWEAPAGQWSRPLPPAPPVLSCRRLGHAFEGRPAVADLSVDVRAGEAVGLVGPAGSGKSTAVRLVCGLLDPDRGEVRLNGRPAGTLDRAALQAAVGYVAQSVVTLPTLTVSGTAVLHARILGLPPAAAAARAAEAVAAAGLTEHADRRVQRCSGGVLRELGLAVALLARPRLIVLDEPGTGLDARALQRLHGTLARLRDSGTAVLYACRRADEVRGLCTRIHPLDGGRTRAAAHPSPRTAAVRSHRPRHEECR